MKILKKDIEAFLIYCKTQKKLDPKTTKAYRIDLRQFQEFVSTQNSNNLSDSILNNYVINQHSKYSVKTVKRKIASTKVFLNFLKEHNLIDQQAVFNFKSRVREPKKLPKTIALHTLSKLFYSIYRQQEKAQATGKHKNLTRDIAVVELLIGTGIRVSELCSLKVKNVDLISGTLKICGKGNKERLIPFNNSMLVEALKNYSSQFKDFISDNDYFFVNSNGTRLSEQSVRFMLKRHCEIAGINTNITPHMFRHTFATTLLEQDVDIRYIQKMLGHSSISVTEIYTFVSSSKQRDILLHKNPRNLVVV